MLLILGGLFAGGFESENGCFRVVHLTRQVHVWAYVVSVRADSIYVLQEALRARQKLDKPATLPPGY